MRCRIQTTNQPSSISAFDIDLNAEQLGQVTGWNPQGESVRKLLERLGTTSTTIEVRTTKVPGDRGTDHVAYLMHRIPEVALREERETA